MFTDMSGKVFVVITLLVVLLVSSAASSPVEAKETKMLQQLLDKREKVKDLGGRQNPAPPAFATRVQRRAHLSEDERESMTKQIMQAISGMLGIWVGVFLNCFLMRVRNKGFGGDSGRGSDVFTSRLCVVHVGMVCSQR